MRRTGRGRYRNNWYRSKNKGNINSDDSSLNNTSTSARVTSTAGSSRAPANQLPIVISVGTDLNNIWKLYFPSDEKGSNETVAKHINSFKLYINKNRNLFDLEKIDQTHSVPLDVQNLQNDDEFIQEWSSFTTDLFENPVTTLSTLEYCLHETLNCAVKLKVRILNHQPVIPIASLKVNYFGKLVTIKGTVIRVGSIGLICTSMAFECSSCHSVQAVIQPQGVFTAPNFCQSCNSGVKFEPLQSSPYTNTTDWQVAKIQEIQSHSISGTIPRSVEIELQGDLVGTACPGDVLSVTGIVQVRGESKGGEDGKRAARLLQLYIEAISIHSQRNLSNPTLSFTLKDYYAIQEIHGSDDVFRLLVHSLCPTIFGHEAVKAGLILGLLGGTEHENGPRSNPHILVVGDPGLGKSQLLQAAAHAAPRGVYVCGASASAGGLTVALGREAGGDFALEAGALVLADKGVCCIDELDKMKAHHSSLLEAMEQRRVSVAKGGVVCSLAARATVLAAANPAAGSYNSQRLRLKPGEEIDNLPLVLLRKYIAYAQRYVHPKLSKEAATALQEFYLELRHNHDADPSGGTPITTRQLEACIRLTQARARVELREEATVDDANDVISLMKHSLIDTFSDEFGNIQLSRSINGSGVSSKSKLKKYLEALTRQSHQLGKDIFTRQELIQIHKAAGVQGDANDLIEAMHIHSYLLLKASNTYQLIPI
ncbi:DNA helicase MCM8 isoform X2 [Bombyx mori]|uniref:DNA helicase MCM8 n=1 Tax=Bombyx mori TaxID=7091 RepID=A0A8R2AN04_BOMMO|nr:DNA helicase MCM8 isoform X3 [Bombyx mori]